MLLTKPIEFDIQFNVNISRLLLVGVGGTGSKLAATIGKLLWHMKSANVNIPEVIFIDPDIIERKNVNRQNFAYADVGWNKAQLMATKVNTVYGLDVKHLPLPLDNSIIANNDIVIGCVDNHHARKEIADSLQDMTDNFQDTPTWIDCGNNKYSGQVVIGNSIVYKHYEITKSPSAVRYLPAPHIVLPALLEPDNETEDMSCADALIAGEQDVLINSWIANIAADYLKKIMFRIPITTYMTQVYTNPVLKMQSKQITPNINNIQA